jgi:TfoX/Sxy family transcriptional regulator of competence genes
VKGGAPKHGSPEERFEELVVVLSQIDGVTPPDSSRGFGSHALRIRKKIFAMVVRGRLVVKLPESRVDALVDSGQGTRFDANKGTPMKEWLSLDPASAVDWEELAREALAFVGGL